MNYVKNYNLKFKSGMQKRAKTNLIVIHHTQGGTTETVKSIHAYHQSKGHKGIDYNICVEKDGTVVWGRGLDYVGGHTSNSYYKTKGVNSRSVGIVALGNMEKNQMPKAQLEAMKKITREVARHFKIKDIKSHKEIAGSGYTDCPGRYFPLEEIRAYALGVESIVPEESDPLIWKVAVGTLNFRESASGKSRILKVLKKGDKVRLDRYVAGEDWARVYVGEEIGFVWLKYIEEA